MEKLNARCVVELSKEAEEISPEIIDVLNRIVSSPKSLSSEDIYVRTMFVTSDSVNSQGGRFPLDEIERLCRLIPGAPVMVGHDKSRLPIARCFKSELVDRNSQKWVKAWFYWLRTTAGADDLCKNIDGGIYTECSLGFSFGLPECSICGGDIRKCSHIPGREYIDRTGQKGRCHFLYRRISRVNEISLVYRGAVPGTAISDHNLSPHHKIDESTSKCGGALRVSDLSRFAVYAFGGGGATLDIRAVSLGSRIVIFPNFSGKLLIEGKIMVGYNLTDSDVRNRCESIDMGTAQILERTDNGSRLKLEGKHLNGEYVLRTAILQNEKVTLFYRVS